MSAFAVIITVCEEEASFSFEVNKRECGQARSSRIYVLGKVLINVLRNSNK